MRSLQLLRVLRRRWQLHIVAGEGDLAEAGRLANALAATVDVAEPGRRSRGIREVAGGLRQGMPVGMARHHQPRLARAVSRRLAETPVDLAMIQGIHLAGVRRSLGDLPVVLDFENIEGQIWHRYAQLWRFPARQLIGFEGDRLLRYQARLAEGVVAACCVSEPDAGWLREHAPRARVIVVPNTVEVPRRIPARASDGPILFVGALDWFANVDGLRWFLSDVWPRVQAVDSRARFDIVGRPPRRSASDLKLSRPGVRYLGAVNSLEKHYASSAVVVVPLRVGGGTRLKILEAFSRGLPVVSTAVGADGLEVVPGRHLLEANTAEAMAQAIIRLLHDSTTAEQLRSEAFSLVAERYSTEAAARALEALPAVNHPLGVPA